MARPISYVDRPDGNTTFKLDDGRDFTWGGPDAQAAKAKIQAELAAMPDMRTAEYNIPPADKIGVYSGPVKAGLGSSATSGTSGTSGTAPTQAPETSSTVQTPVTESAAGWVSAEPQQAGQPGQPAQGLTEEGAAAIAEASLSRTPVYTVKPHTRDTTSQMQVQKGTQYAPEDLAALNQSFADKKSALMQRSAAEVAASEIQDENAVIMNRMGAVEADKEAQFKAQQDALVAAEQKKLDEHKIDPNRVWNNMSTFQKGVSYLGAMLAGWQGGYTGKGGNEFLDHLNGVIDMDIKAQLNAQGQQEKRVGAQKEVRAEASADYQKMKLERLNTFKAVLDSKLGTLKSEVLKANAMEAMAAIDDEKTKLSMSIAERTQDKTVMTQNRQFVPGGTYGGQIKANPRLIGMLASEALKKGYTMSDINKALEQKDDATKAFMLAGLAGVPLSQHSEANVRERMTQSNRHMERFVGTGEIGADGMTQGFLAGTPEEAKQFRGLTQLKSFLAEKGGRLKTLAESFKLGPIGTAEKAEYDSLFSEFAQVYTKSGGASLMDPELANKFVPLKDLKEPGMGIWSADVTAAWDAMPGAVDATLAAAKNSNWSARAAVLDGSPVVVVDSPPSASASGQSLNGAPRK